MTMKKKLLNTLFILLACVLSVAAQEDTKDKKIKIKIIEEVDGERKVVEREYGSREEMKNDPALKDMNIEFLEKADGFSFKSKDGDHVIIKRIDGEEGLHDKDVHVFITEDEKGDLHIDNTFIFKSDEGKTVDFEAGDHTFEIRKDDEGNVIVIKDGKEIEDFEFGEDGMANGENLFFFKSDDDDHEKTVIRHVKVRKIHVENISKKDPELENLNLGSKKELNVDGLNYYPNPSEGALNLAFKGDARATEIRITDINGKVVHQDVMPDFDGIFDKTIDLSSQPSGIYVLQIIQGNRALNKKLVIE